MRPPAEEIARLSILEGRGVAGERGNNGGSAIDVNVFQGAR